MAYIIFIVIVLVIVIVIVSVIAIMGHQCSPVLLCVVEYWPDRG